MILLSRKPPRLKPAYLVLLLPSSSRSGSRNKMGSLHMQKAEALTSAWRCECRAKCNVFCISPQQLNIQYQLACQLVKDVCHMEFEIQRMQKQIVQQYESAKLRESVRYSTGWFDALKSVEAKTGPASVLASSWEKNGLNPCEQRQLPPTPPMNPMKDLKDAKAMRTKAKAAAASKAVAMKTKAAKAMKSMKAKAMQSVKAKKAMKAAPAVEAKATAPVKAVACYGDSSDEPDEWGPYANREEAEAAGAWQPMKAMKAMKS